MNQQDLTKLYGQLSEQTSALQKFSGSVKDLLQAMDADRRRQIWLPVCSKGYRTDFVVWKGPVFLKSWVAYNKNSGTSYWIQTRNIGWTLPDSPDSTSISPQDLAPELLAPLGNSSFDDGGEGGVYFDQGIYLSASTSDAALLKPATADVIFYALFRPA